MISMDYGNFKIEVFDPLFLEEIKTSAKKYLEEVSGLLERIEDTQADSILEAATIVAESIINGGIIHTFGTGHSHMIAEEPCCRASTIIAVNAMLVPGLKADTYATLSYEAERLEGYAKHILDYYKVSRKDVLIIISNSGRNAVPIEMAMEAKTRGIKVVAITSLDYSKAVPSRHSSGKKLYEIADIVIDNCCPLGEGLINVEGVRVKVGPSSTVTGAAIIHAIMVQATQNMVEKGVEPPVCMSGNLPGSDEYNKKFFDKYRNRIKIL